MPNYVTCRLVVIGAPVLQARFWKACGLGDPDAYDEIDLDRMPGGCARPMWQRKEEAINTAWNVALDRSVNFCTFTTAWSPPNSWVSNATAAHPGLVLQLFYADEDWPRNQGVITSSGVHMSVSSAALSHVLFEEAAEFEQSRRKEDGDTRAGLSVFTKLSDADLRAMTAEDSASDEPGTDEAKTAAATSAGDKAAAEEASTPEAAATATGSVAAAGAGSGAGAGAGADDSVAERSKKRRRTRE